MSRYLHHLQQSLMESQAARLLAVRHVTQENEGRDTAGVDGVKSVPPQGRLALAFAIHPDQWHQQPALPVLRVWIPKPGTTEQRPLGIPSMIDRCKQALATMALEPEWEAKFEPHSYGYRPSRGVRDAIAAIVFAIEHRPAFVFDADIQGAFDHLNQQALLDKLSTYPAFRQAIDGWLKAGVMDGGTCYASETGIPQGSVLSPLLLNVALHGMETVVITSDTNMQATNSEQPLVIRYADDFLMFHSHLDELQKAAARVTDWLKQMGLSLNTRKTRITHTLTPYQGHDGFDFLGFTIRQYPIKQTDLEQLPTFKMVITPDAEASHQHLAAIAQELYHLRDASQVKIIHKLNPIISGWAMYYSEFVSEQTMSRYDDLVRHLLLNWAGKRHPSMNNSELLSRYWRQVDRQAWVFSTPEGIELHSHSQMSRYKPTSIEATANPYNEKTG